MNLILYIGFAQKDEWEHWAGTYSQHALRFEMAASGIPCLVIPYTLASSEFIGRLNPSAVVMSGFARSFQDYEVRSFDSVVSWVKQTDVPTLALCGSHQLLGFAYNQDLNRCDKLIDEPMRYLYPHEPVLNPDYHPEYYMERGFFTLDLSEYGRTDPLLQGLKENSHVFESHYCEIKSLPSEFDLLASTKECRIQAIKHKNKKLYGVQFHPEDYRLEPEIFSNGKSLLENFFTLALDR